MITINAKQAPSLIMKILKAKLCPILTGSPGLGKSDIIRAIAKENGLKVIDLRLSQMDPVDLSGLPFINGENTRSDFLPPAYFPLEGDPIPSGYNGWLVFFDEINSAPQSIQAASYKIILDRMIGQTPIHSKVAIVAAGNKSTDRAITHKMSTALQSRMVHLELEVNHKHWITWANEKEIDYRILAYINFKPDALFQFKPDHNDCTFASPRTWHFLSDMIKDENEISNDILPLITGTISEGVGREFKAFTQIFESLPTIHDIKNDPTGISVSNEPSINFAITSLIAHHITSENAGVLMQFVVRLPIEFQIVLLRQALAKDKKILTTASVKSWIQVNSKELFD